MKKILVAAATIVLGCGLTAQAQTFLSIDLGAQATVVAGINDRGEAVVLAFDGDSSAAYLCDRYGAATPLDIDIPGARGVFPLGINNRGDIVGMYEEEDGAPSASWPPRHGFLREASGAITIIDYVDPDTGIPARDTNLMGINDAGEIVGFFGVDEANGWYTNHGLLRHRDGSFETFDHPLAPPFYGTEPNGITAGGEITGTYSDGARSHGFVLHRNGQFQDIDFPGALSISIVTNDRGQIVGTYSGSYYMPKPWEPWIGDPTSLPHGFFVARDGTSVTSDPLVGVNSEAWGFNNAGTVTGCYKAEDGRILGYIAASPFRK